LKFVHANVPTINRVHRNKAEIKIKNFCFLGMFPLP